MRREPKPPQPPTRQPRTAAPASPHRVTNSPRTLRQLSKAYLTRVSHLRYGDAWWAVGGVGGSGRGRRGGVRSEPGVRGPVVGGRGGVACARRQQWVRRGRDRTESAVAAGDCGG